MSATLAANKKKIRQSFAAVATTYDEFACLQRQVGLDLIARFNLTIANQNVVDLGCGTGFLMQQLLAQAAARQMIAIDVARPMLQIARAKLKPSSTVQFICADAEKLPLRSSSIDTLASNLALQWCQNLAQLLQDVNRVLTAGGRLLFATFGEQTLCELKQAWAQVDSYTHVNDFYPAASLDLLLRQAGFNNIRIERQCYRRNYPSVLALMRGLKGIGANQMLFGANKISGKLRLQAMLDAYEDYRVNGAIPATYDVIFVSATS